MSEFRDVDGLTAKEWAEQLFEFEYCNECGGDVEDHNYVLLMGHWFAVCKNEGNNNDDL